MAPDVAQLRQNLAPGECLLEYFGKDDVLFSFVATQDAVRARRLHADGLASAVASFRGDLLRVRTDVYRARARALYERLVAPVECWLDCKNLTVVPHGVLHYLPFAALMAG